MIISYHNLSDRQFEELVIEFCCELLGPSVQGYVSGRDGGRDARFNGQARDYPDWNGVVIVQAKHTEMPNRSFSESDFSGYGESSILGKEIPRIRRLVSENELNYYMLFANRRLTGVEDAVVRNRIAIETGLEKDCIRLFDESELDRLAKRLPDAVERACLNPAKSPPEIDPRDLAEVIVALASYRPQLDVLLEGTEPPPEHRITPDQKNAARGLRIEYFRRQIQPTMIDFAVIRRFLSHPENQMYVRLYEDTAAEVDAKLDAWANPDEPFEKLIEILLSRLCSRDNDLRKHRKLTRTVVYYMYCNCDIVRDLS
jgi:hypothetical protein